MRRFILIIIASMLALTGRAQEVEMFSIERELCFPGVPKEVLYKGISGWSDNWEELDYSPVIAGFNAHWTFPFQCKFRNVVLDVNGNEYLCHINGHCIFYASDEGIRVEFSNVNAWHVESKAGWITHIGLIPLADFGYWQGTARNRKERISVRIKEYLTVWFDSICGDLLSNLETFPMDQVII